MIWIEIEFRRDGESKAVEAAFDRVPIEKEEIEVDRFYFRVHRVKWTIRLDENENPIGQAEPTVIAEFIGEKTA